MKTVRLVLLALFLSALPISAGAAEVTLRIHHFLSPESAPQKLLLEPWAERVERDSGGRIDVEIYPEMKLGGKAGQLVDQVVDGSVDIVWTAAAYTPGRFPRAEVFTLPTVHQGDAVATNLAIHGLLDGALAGDFSMVRPLLVHVHRGHAFHTTYRAIRSLDDFAGLTLRSPGRGIGQWTVEALGAAPTKKRHPKLPRALEHKALDGVLMSFQLARALEVIEAAKFHTMLENGGTFGTSLYLFLMNKARYDALPADLRAVIVRQSGTALAREMGEAWNRVSNASIDLARERGNEIIAVGGQRRERMTSALQSVAERWAKTVGSAGIDGTQLLKSAREAVTRNGSVAR